MAIAPYGLQAWISVYRLARPMGLAQVLESLERLAEQLGLPGELDGWERSTFHPVPNQRIKAP